jgi:hypothetical protein
MTDLTPDLTHGSHCWIYWHGLAHQPERTEHDDRRSARSHLDAG